MAVGASGDSQLRSEKRWKSISATQFNITPECIFRTKMPMKLGFIFAIADKIPESMRTVADRRAVYTSACRCACRRDQRDGAGETQRCFCCLIHMKSMDPFLQLD